MPIKVSEYIAKRLATVYNVKHVFLVSGGGAMHLNDAFGSQKQIEYICNHHEQACAIAAEGYARHKQELAVVNVTTGPGGLNTLNGVFGQWTDSVPVLYISGQVKYETTMASCPELNIRQLGDQEVDIISVVKPITKYAEMLTNPLDVKKILDKAIHLALSGRKGPVWIDIPINVQGALIDENNLEEYIPKLLIDQSKGSDFQTQLDEILAMLQVAKRPLIVAGHGVRLAKSELSLIQLLKLLNLPVVTTLNGCDLITDDHPNYIGRIGTIGQRAGNFALQNADLVIFMGTRNNIRQISYNWAAYASKAKKIVIDIDKAELFKPTLKADLAINEDLAVVLPLLNTLISQHCFNFSLSYQDWLDWCIIRKQKYAPLTNPDYQHKNEKINPYAFMLQLTNIMQPEALVVTGNATVCICLFQTISIKANQRILWNSGNASMGYDLPAAIGLCLAAGKKDTICLAGDGSIMMNLQELQTIKHYNLPIKLFILNNDGYISIKQTQNNFFAGNLTGSSPSSGVSIPDFIKLAKGFDIPAIRIESVDDLNNKLNSVLEHKGPIICEVMLDCDYIFSPKLSSEKLPDGRMISKPLEDMFPFLDRQEFAENML